MSIQEFRQSVEVPPGAGMRSLPMARLVVAGFAGSALVTGVFVVPFLVAVPPEVVSASALAGYNNTAAYVCYLVLLPGAAVAVSRLLPDCSALPEALPSGASVGLSRPVLLVIAGHVALFVGLYLVKGYFVFGDAMYFQQVLARMVGGAVPYRDLNFFYGPVMLYPPYWLSRVVSVSEAYAVYYTAMYLAGLYALAMAVKVSVGDSKFTGLFVLCALGFFNHTLGLNYVFVRGLLPAAAVIAFWLYLEKPACGRLGIAAAVLFGALAYSPEMGLLATLTNLLVAALKGGLPMLKAWPGGMPMRGASVAIGRVLLVCGLAWGGLLVGFYLMDPSFRALAAFFKPMVNQVGGAGNRPIYFNLPILGLMVVSVLVLGVAIRMVRERPDAPITVLVLALTALSIMMERMAFGVPDSLHVVNNCLPLFLLGLFLAARMWPGSHSLRWYGAVLVIAFMLPLQVFNAFMFKPYVERRLGLTQTAAASTGVGATSRDIEESLERLIERLGPEKPYYLHALQYYSLPAVLRWHLVQPVYFTILEEVQVPQDAGRIIRDLRESATIVVTPRTGFAAAGAPRWGGWEDWLYQLTASPLPGSRTFSQLAEVKARLEQPVMGFLRESYCVAAEDGALVALVPR